MDDSRLVYSTESGRICPACKKPISKCACKKNQRAFNGDGIIRIWRETKGRKGKTVTAVSGFQIDADELKNVATQLKRRCGTGGSVKDGIIIIQGDHKETLLSELKKQGYKAKHLNWNTGFNSYRPIKNSGINKEGEWNENFKKGSASPKQRHQGTRKEDGKTDLVS